MELDVRRGQLGPRAEEPAGLGQVRAQRAAALAVQQLEVLRREDPEERRLAAEVVEVRHEVVLQVPPDRQLLAHRDPERRQLLLEPDPGEHQQHGRLIRAGRDDHLALGADRLAHAVAHDLDTDRAFAVEDDALDEGAILHLEVGPVGRGMEVGVGGAAAQAAALGQLEAADAVLHRTVQVRVRRMAGLDSRLEHQVDERMHRAAVGDRLRTADSVVGVLAALVVLAALEVRSAPRRSSSRCSPPPPSRRSRGRLPRQVDHRVDRAAAADHPAAREVEPAAVEAGLLLAEQVPVEARLEHDREHRGHADLRRDVRAAASSSTTLTSGSSVRRAASTQPADPAPTIT